ncbi:MAG: 2-amino-4-hydroxy-6-hydroxymethyldihydropteridine diphosphokinase [Saprospiraceae bacterium]
MSKYYLHLGSNLGNRKENLESAIHKINELIGSTDSISSIYETEPWGNSEQNNFLNLAMIVESQLVPKECMVACKEIENTIGPPKTEKWGPRYIDIDILYCDSMILKSDDLIIPHSSIYDRNFVLIPLMEIAGDFIDPIKNLSIEELYDLCLDKGEVFLYEE